MYTQKEKEQFKKILKHFNNMIEQNDTIDVLWSRRNGCVYLSGVDREKSSVDLDTRIALKPAELYAMLMDEIVAEAMCQLNMNKKELYELNDEEKAKVEKSIEDYTDLFSEYKNIVDAIFIIPNGLRDVYFSDIIKEKSMDFKDYYVDLIGINNYAREKGKLAKDLSWQEKERFIHKRGTYHSPGND